MEENKFYPVANTEYPSLRFVVIGFGTMGKSCMLVRFFRKAFPEIYIPTVVDHDSQDVECEGKIYNVLGWDTSCAEDEWRGPLYYPQTDVYILLNAVNQKDRLEEIESHWWPKLKLYDPDVSVILVGSKVDLRDKKSVSLKEGRQMAKKIGAACYMECSSKDDIGVTEVFEEAIKLSGENQATKKNKNNKCKCYLL